MPLNKSGSGFRNKHLGARLVSSTREPGQLFILNMSEQNIIDRLFAAGSHFGFKKSRRHPSMRPFLFGTKEGNDIFDLEHSAALLEEAKEALKQAGSEGKTVLFVGTKEEASRLVRAAAEKAETPYVTNRWVGGMITNWSEIKKRLNRLAELVTMGETGELERKYTKKERVMINRELQKLIHNFGGIRELDRIPDMMLIVDARHDNLAVKEAKEKELPIVAIMSSDNDAKEVEHPVVVNDTLQSSINLALNELTAAYMEGKAAYVPKPKPTNGATTRRSTTR